MVTRAEVVAETQKVPDKHLEELYRIIKDFEEKTEDDEIEDIDSELEGEFRNLVGRWRRETAMHSVTLKKAMHPAYQRIIGMGKDAIPLILRELLERPSGHWFWALNAITGEDPAQVTDSIDDAIQAWLRWGREHGYI